MTDARTITTELGGKWHGRYGLTYCPAHDNHRTPALTLANGDHGRLLVSCKAGCSFMDVLAALQARGLVEGTVDRSPPDPFVVAQRETDRRAEVEKRSRQARAVWADAKPITGTLATTYLRGRGITCPLPETLRFHPACWHPTAKRLPALVALVDGGEGFAVHRTYLAPDGTRKAGVDPPKAMLGAVAGGAVRLTYEPGPLVVAEGIETALSLASGLLRGPAIVWAALSTSGMAGLRLPPKPGRLTIASDGDRPGREATHKLAERAHALGWSVSLLAAPENNDWNDVLCAKENRK